MFYASRNVHFLPITVAEIPVLENHTFIELRFQHSGIVY